MGMRKSKLGHSTARERAVWKHVESLRALWRSASYQRLCERQGKRNAARFAKQDGNEIAHIISEGSNQ